MGLLRYCTTSPINRTSLIVDCIIVQLSRLAAPDLPRLHAQGDHLEVDLRQCGQKTDDSLY